VNIVKRAHLALGAAVAAAIALFTRSSSAPKAVASGTGAIEDYAPLEYARDNPVCDPTTKPGVNFFRTEVLGLFGGKDLGVGRDCSKGNPSEHHEGRAWDWGITPGPKADAMLAWLFAPDEATGQPHGVIRRAGVMYVIFNRQIWSVRNRKWVPYTGPSPHTDHVHLSFSKAGAAGDTSFYTSRGVA
jgi:hypothetical protein